MSEPSVLPAAAVADALVRLGREPRFAPPVIRRLMPGEPVVGPAVPVRHRGSVDVFLEAYETAPAGAVLVIDNEGRLDEACIGDLTVGEAKLAGIAGIVLDGLHRDESELRRIGLPVWSRGTLPVGPRGVRPARGEAHGEARIGDVVVAAGDVVVADDDGVVFVDADEVVEVFELAAHILETERRQADRIAAGTSLRQQLGFADYLRRRADDPTYDLRRHLRETGGAIET
jgi:regulator of RNase E activity RraA